MPTVKDSTVIFFVHKGAVQDYLVAAILQAKRSNPGAQICLISDQNEDSLPQSVSGLVTLISLESIGSSATEFEGIFIHRSRNDYQYELFNFQRWHYAKSACESLGHVGPTVVLDSDAFLYLDVDRVFRSMRTDMTVVDRVGPQFAFFRNPSSLSRYVAFISLCFDKPSMYSRLENFVANSQDIGMPHVSDMASLGLFAEQELLEDIGSSEREDFIFCENIGSLQGLRRGGVGKKVSRKNGQRYFTKIDGTRVLAGGVHLQGGNKSLWPMYVEAKVLLRVLSHDPNLVATALLKMVRKITQIQLIRFGTNLRRLNGAH